MPPTQTTVTCYYNVLPSRRQKIFKKPAVLLAWESHTMPQHRSWAQAVKTLTLNPGTGAKRGIICSVLATQYCCLGVNEGWMSSQFPLLNKKANENADVNLSHPWTQQTKAHWTLGINSAVNISFLYLQAVLYYTFLQQWQTQLPRLNNLDLQIYNPLLWGPSKDHLQGNKGLK